MNQLRLILAQFRDLYLRMNGPQRLSIALFAGAIMALLMVFLMRATQVQNDQILFYQVSPTQAASITQKLDSLNIKSKFTNGMITVGPEQSIDKLKMSLAQDGLLPDDLQYDFSKIVNVGAEGMMTVKDERDRNFNIALGNELAKIIMSMDDITDAKVIVGQSEDNPLLKRSMPRTASVTLTVRNRRRLTSDEVKAVCNLVASAVRELLPQNVKITDTAGRPYEYDAEGNASDKFEMKLAQEKQYAVKIEEYLMTFIPKVVARVEIDLDLKKQREEIKDYNAKVLVNNGSAVVTDSLQEKEKSQTKEGSQGVVGADVNTQANIKEGDGGSQMESSKSRKQDKMDNSVQQVFIEHDKGSMVVKSVSVAIVNRALNPDFNPALPQDEKNQEFVEFDWIKNKKDELIDQITKIVDIDKAKVSLTQQPMLLAKTPAPPSSVAGIMGWLALNRVVFMMVGLALIGAFALMKMVKKAQPEEEIIPMPEYAKKEKNELPPLKEPEIDPKVRQIENRVKEIIDEQPQKAAGLIKIWLSSD